MKTTVGGADHDITAHCQFDSWETGIRAQVDHLALYAGAPGYPKSVSAKGTYIVGNNYGRIASLSIFAWHSTNALGTWRQVGISTIW